MKKDINGISVIGLGKLGLCTAACFASKGFDVIGVDINADVVGAVNSKKAPFFEPGLGKLLADSHKRLKATQDYGRAIKDSDISFIVVPTPTDEKGHFSDKYIQDSLHHLAAAFRKAKKRYHIFSITSTVSPGTTEKNLIPLIERLSGARLNKDFGVCYNPEFIALGTVIRNFLNPDMVLIGQSDKRAGEKLEQVYRNTCENKPHIARMSIVSAEITKISLNSYITMKISFANTLAAICSSIPMSDIDDITQALGKDKRISPYCLKGGMPYGGPCFPRDNLAFGAFSKEHNVNALLAEASDRINFNYTNHVISEILKCVGEKDTVAVLGLAYKPNTSVIEESPAVKIIEGLLKQRDTEILVYDPLATSSARAYFGDKILYASSVRECFKHGSVCIIATQSEEFKKINESYIHKHPTTIIDCWRILDARRLEKKARYITLGKPAWKS